MIGCCWIFRRWVILPHPPPDSIAADVVVLVAQALRAEVESRRVLLANQELSLRQRELALERREAESGAASAALRLTATAAAGADSTKSEKEKNSGSTYGAQGEQQLVDRPTPTDRFWPIAREHDAAELEEESGSGTKGEDSGMGVQGEGVAVANVVAVGDHGGSEEEKGEGGGASAQQPPPQAFRCVFGCPRYTTVVASRFVEL